MIEILTNALSAIFMLAVAVALVRIGLLKYAAIAPQDAEAVPLLRLIAISGGVLIGILLIGCLPHLDDFRISRIYGENSPWRRSLLDLLLHETLPSTIPRGRALAGLGTASPLGLAALGYVGIGLVLLGVIAALRLWRGRAAGRAALAVILLASWTALLLHALVHLAAWGATWLNFWTFGLILLAWQAWRYRGPRVAH